MSLKGSIRENVIVKVFLEERAALEVRRDVEEELLRLAVKVKDSWNDSRFTEAEKSASP